MAPQFLEDLTVAATTRWLVNNGVNVVCFTADLGQPDERNIEEIRERMLACGARNAILVNAKEALAQAGIQVIQCQAQYEGGYWNTTFLFEPAAFMRAELQ